MKDLSIAEVALLLLVSTGDDVALNGDKQFMVAAKKLVNESMLLKGQVSVTRQDSTGNTYVRHQGPPGSAGPRIEGLSLKPAGLDTVNQIKTALKQAGIAVSA